MVNPRVDHYAALELRPNADPDEIKKQFKKLGNCSLNQPILLPSVADRFPKPGSTIQTAIQAKRKSSRRSSKRSRLPTKSYPTPNSARNTTRREGRRASIPTPLDPITP
jgi:hypothetical protein